MKPASAYPMPSGRTRPRMQDAGFLPFDTMDTTLEFLSGYAASLDYRDLPPDTVHETRRRILDSTGCALGAFAAEPCRIARSLAPAVEGDGAARILGTGQSTSPDMAAFANTAMIRYLDCNDSFVSAGGGHPSDMLPAVLAAADVAGASGRAVIAALPSWPMRSMDTSPTASPPARRAGTRASSSAWRAPAPRESSWGCRLTGSPTRFP